MLNEQQWQQEHSEFLSESETLLLRSDECLSHLELIVNDRDAIDCLLASLRHLAAKADNARVERIAGFARQLHDVLHVACPATALQGETLHTLKGCITLLAWQFEFIDRSTGQMILDEGEQRELLNHLAALCGLDCPQDASNPGSAPRPLQQASLACPPHA